METPQHPHPPCPDSHSLPTPEEWPPAPSGTSESTGDFPILSLHRMQRNPFLFSLRGHRRVPPFSPHRTEKGSSILSLKNTGESLCSPLTEHGGGSLNSLPSENTRAPPISPLRSQRGSSHSLPSPLTGGSPHSPLRKDGVIPPFSPLTKSSHPSASPQTLPNLLRHRSPNRFTSGPPPQAPPSGTPAPVPPSPPSPNSSRKNWVGPAATRRAPNRTGATRTLRGLMAVGQGTLAPSVPARRRPALRRGEEVPPPFILPPPLAPPPPPCHWPEPARGPLPLAARPPAGGDGAPERWRPRWPLPIG